MAMQSVLHEMDVRCVALAGGASARLGGGFEDWRYGSGEASALLTDVHARVAHHHQHSRNEVWSWVSQCSCV
jgi:hypothetical protein